MHTKTGWMMLAVLLVAATGTQAQFDMAAPVPTEDAVAVTPPAVEILNVTQGRTYRQHDFSLSGMNVPFVTAGDSCADTTVLQTPLNLDDFLHREFPLLVVRLDAAGVAPEDVAVEVRVNDRLPADVTTLVAPALNGEEIAILAYGPFDGPDPASRAPELDLVGLWPGENTIEVTVFTPDGSASDRRTVTVCPDDLPDGGALAEECLCNGEGDGDPNGGGEGDAASPCRDTVHRADSLLAHDVKIARGFGDQDDRDQMRAAIEAKLQQDPPIYGIYPATTFALSEGAATTGYAGALARHVAGEDAIWETERRTAPTQGNTRVTVSVAPATCEVTWYAASMIFAGSAARIFDPVREAEESAGLALEMGRAIKDLSVALASNVPIVGPLIAWADEELTDESAFLEVQSRAHMTHRISGFAAGTLDVFNQAQIVRQARNTIKSEGQKSLHRNDRKSAIVKGNTLTFDLTGRLEVTAQALGNGVGTLQADSGWAVAWAYVCECGDRKGANWGFLADYSGEHFQRFNQTVPAAISGTSDRLLADPPAGGEAVLQALEAGLKDWLEAWHPKGREFFR